MKKLIAVLAGVLLLLPSLTMALEPFNKDLRYGMTKNAEVKRMQEFLRDEGLYKGAITGNYYALTRDAIRKYQKNNGLKVTGLFDKVTRSKVNEMGVVVNDEVSPTPVVDNSLSIPLGWISNGDGTFSSPSTYQTQPSVVYNSQPVVNTPSVNNNQPVVTQPTQPSNSSSEVKMTNPQSPTSMPTTTPTSTPMMVVLNSTILNQSRTPYPSYYPFYYYVNCSPTSTDNRFDINVFDNSLDIQSVITSKTYRDLGYFALLDQIIYNNDRNAWEKPEYWDLLAKAPKIKSITIKNAGTADLRSINFSMDYEVPSAKKDLARIVVFTNGIRTNILPSSLTKDTATFNFPSPLPTNFNDTATSFYLLGDADKVKKNETINFQVIGADLENNDPARNYTVKLPVETELDGTTKKRRILTKCDLKS